MRAGEQALQPLLGCEASSMRGVIATGPCFWSNAVHAGDVMPIKAGFDNNEQPGTCSLS